MSELPKLNYQQEIIQLTNAIEQFEEKKWNAGDLYSRLELLETKLYLLNQSVFKDISRQMRM